MLRSIVIAMACINIDYFYYEISILWSYTPWIYYHEGIHGITPESKIDKINFAYVVFWVWAAISASSAGYFLKFGKLRMLIVLNALVIISSWVIMIRSYVWLVIAKAIHGICIGIIGVTWLTFINSISKVSTKGQEIALFHLFIEIGLLLIHLAALFTYHFHPSRI